MKIKSIAIIFISSLGCLHAEEAFELSPFQITGRSGLPPATIKRTGDNLVLQVQIQNDSRVYEQREEELYATILDLVLRAEKNQDIIIDSGEFELDSRNYKVKLSEASQRTDTTYTSLYIKTPLSEESDVPKLSDMMRSFASATKAVGRTEVFPNQIGISIVNPEKYRYEVMEAIAADIQRTKEIFGSDFKVIIDGLDQRVLWQRTSISEIEIYIPYEFIVAPMKLLDW